MIKYEWIFFDADGSKAIARLPGLAPTPGDGKYHAGKGFVVHSVISGRVLPPNNVVIAYEVPIETALI